MSVPSLEQYAAQLSHETLLEMLWFMVSVSNEGRLDVRVSQLDIEVLDPRQEGYRTFSLHPQDKIRHGKDKRGYYTPMFQGWSDGLKAGEAGGVVKSHDGRSFYVALPANGGYDKWKRVNLRVSAVGVEPADDVDPVVEADAGDFGAWDGQVRLGRPGRRLQGRGRR